MNNAWLCQSTSSITWRVKYLENLFNYIFSQAALNAVVDDAMVLDSIWKVDVVNLYLYSFQPTSMFKPAWLSYCWDF